MTDQTETDRPGLPVEQAAAELDLSPGQLRRLVARGAPCVQRGQRGRGRVMLVDPEAVRMWSGASARDAALLELAAVLPEILATAVDDAFRLDTGPHKAATAGALGAAWVLASSAVLDLLRERCASVPQANGHLPEPIERLRKIANSQQF
ncbi:hypothetical protein H010_00580 [Hydrogenophaga taeniospiralis CCUG 15921]|uniref:Helix-turn-helix domain-containing protein n=1 Tax=Hydrogenophaga taeniospiralis CCUG 15921 TaxID=1281780 RepID=A0A9X4P0L2_9BURK|nr:hypothetical protein [Hydrogenophaga taeniospiralis]MDG5973723.1 hypothetical protein [Hydrogenophaga taeniospiralis CCUG 15921]